MDAISICLHSSPSSGGVACGEVRERVGVVAVGGGGDQQQKNRTEKRVKTTGTLQDAVQEVVQEVDSAAGVTDRVCWRYTVQEIEANRGTSVHLNLSDP